LRSVVGVSGSALLLTGCGSGLGLLGIVGSTRCAEGVDGVVVGDELSTVAGRGGGVGFLGGGAGREFVEEGDWDGVGRFRVAAIVVGEGRIGFGGTIGNGRADTGCTAY